MISLALLTAISLDAARMAQTSATLNALGPHPFGSPRNQAAAQFVAAKLKESGLAQTVVEDFDADGAQGTNVVANLPGRTDRLLIIATHHDSRKDSDDVSGRSRSLSLLIELGRQASTIRPAKTWILASFDGGEAKGEGLAHYLESLGKSRALVDAVVLMDAAPGLEASGEPSIIVPACAQGASSSQRAIAGRDVVSAALSAIPAGTEVAFDDPGIQLLTQPFIRAFRTECDPTAARALASDLSVIQVSDVPFSKTFMTQRGGKQGVAPARDTGAANLGDIAWSAIQGLDASTPLSPQSDSWLVVGRTTWSGFVVLLIGLAALIPGLIASRSGGTQLGLRIAFSALFAAALYLEPEVTLFVGLLPALYPPGAPRKWLTLTFLPLGVLVAAGLFGVVRGHVHGTWLSVWSIGLLLGTFVLLFAAPSGKGKARAPGRAKRGKR